MSTGALRARALALALVLGGLAGLFAWRAGSEGGGGRGGEAPSTALGRMPAERVPEARARLARLLEGLRSLQEADGAFALEAPSDRPSLPEPEVKRAGAAGLAAWAFVEAATLGVGLSEGLAARDRTLAYLVSRQQADGSLGRLPPSPLGIVDRGPEVTALNAALLACASSKEAAQALLVGRATRTLAPLLAKGELRDGWPRALTAMAVDALVRAGRGEGLGREPRKALALGTTRADPDCGDYRLAEAIVRSMRGETLTEDPYPEAVLAACLTRETPVWSGQTTDVRSWLLQAWLAARSPQGPAWFEAALAALEEALGPAGLVPGGIYADRVTQSACAALVICLGLRPQP